MDRYRLSDLTGMNVVCSGCVEMDRYRLSDLTGMNVVCSGCVEINNASGEIH